MLPVSGHASMHREDRKQFSNASAIRSWVIVKAFASVFAKIIDLPWFEFKLGGVVNQFDPVALNQ
jgi:hypothetical protein